MFRFAPYVIKGLWRHRARTLLTLTGTTVAIFVFCMVASIQEGLGRLSTDEIARRTLIVFQENRFCPTSSRLPQDYGGKIAMTPGVRKVLPMQVWTNNCRASLDIVVFNGVPKEQLRESREWTLISGSWLEFENKRDAALVGRQVAKRRGLRAGDHFSIGELSVKIAGIYSSSVPAEENLIYTGLEFLQLSRGIEMAGLVTQFEVSLDDSADPENVAAAIDQILRDGPVATTTRNKGAFQASTLADLVDLIGFAHWLGYACVGLVLALVGTTTVMSVQDRVKEHAILQTIGVRPGRVFRIIVAESVTICVAGGVFGTFAALTFLTWSGLAVGAEGVTIAFRPSVHLAFLGTGVSLFVGLVAGSIPAAQAATASIVASLHHG